jgi:N utilization substance protein B
MTRPRHRAREAALQVLYLSEVGRATPGEALEAYFASGEHELNDAARAFTDELVAGTASEAAELDALIQRHLTHWRLERVAVLDRLILRMAAWELRHHADTPPAVVLDEAIELARTFSTDESVRFVNGVLDGIRKGLAAGGQD